MATKGIRRRPGKAAPGRPATGRGARGRAARAVAGERSIPARLWAPWRMEYIEAEKPAGCIFCEFPAARGEDDDRAHLIAHRSERSFTLLNRYPYNSGHVMVIPRAHVAQLEDLSPDEFVDLHAELRLASQVLRRVYRPQGLNVGMNLGRVAGAGIDDHLHYHVVPRWAGDTNFMPVLAGTRVMVEHLESAWRKIREGFQTA